LLIGDSSSKNKEIKKIRRKVETGGLFCYWEREYECETQDFDYDKGDWGCRVLIFYRTPLAL
jgi:hypothetical protein